MFYSGLWPLELDVVITAIDSTIFLNLEHHDQFVRLLRFSVTRAVKGMALCLAAWR